LDDNAIAAAVIHVCDGIDPNADLYASSDYRCHLAQVHARRAIQAAKANAK
jgi:CO/xanthine dehydrogenase FAD-binding subunit